jgi:hypothetical protein
MPADIAGFMSSPGGVASLFTGGLPKIAQALIGSGFTAQQVYSAIKAPNNVERIKNMLFAVGGAAGTKEVMFPKGEISAKETGAKTETPGVQAQKLEPGAEEGVHLRDTPQDRLETQTAEVAPQVAPVPEQLQPEIQQPIEPPRPKLLHGETQGDLISSTQQEPFKLAGEKLPEQETEPEPSAEEQAQMQDEYERDLLAEAEQHMARGGDELLDVLKDHGLPVINNAKHYTGELKYVREMFNKPGGFSTLVSGEKVKYADIFKKDAGDLDSLTQELKTKGFDVETVSDTLDLIHKRLVQGKKIWGSEARGNTLEAASMGWELPESAFPQVGLVQGIVGQDALFKIGQKLNTARKSLQSMIRARPQRDKVAATYDAIDNGAAIAGDHAGNEARMAVGGDDMDKAAVIPVI